MTSSEVAATCILYPEYKTIRGYVLESRTLCSPCHIVPVSKGAVFTSVAILGNVQTEPSKCCGHVDTEIEKPSRREHSFLFLFSFFSLLCCPGVTDRVQYQLTSVALLDDAKMTSNRLWT
ncbi:hypothetical protein BaRGS_00011854 [Batillaria attramentaria]|uniref:Uncharacterized protein n=1 Tax=Batillaria attramentaria TaxID=370345 RepID=A0ABD0LBJ6_9CAEN